MHVVQRVPRRVQRRMNLPSERQVVNGVGLGEVDGLFNIGKMFTRLTHVTKHSFDFKNILGAVGSGVMTLSTGGVANVVSEIAGPSGLKLTKTNLTSQHGKLSEFIGGAMVPIAGLLPQRLTGMTHTEAFGSDVTLAIGAAVAGGYMLAPLLPAIGGAGVIGTEAAATGGGGFLSMIGSGLSTVGSGFMNVMKALPMVGQVFGDGGGQQQQVDPYLQQYANAQVQANYDAQVRQQQAALNVPAGYSPSIPFVAGNYPGSPIPADMNTSYGDLRSPYMAIGEDGQQIQVDPRTGEVVTPAISTNMWLGGGAIILLLGMYMMQGDDKK